ncbi:hypothetical protein JCM16418_2350 [Paenibacillus pini JCM 16418]|uniref:Uncharacterized protein n=1 Tax=Paenibacillus pini JCM 16418 TaxID=1236976 RepID=W7Z1N0_9BACL|nr:hypothetical protein JCM16418_2350 [Paenibacillus pini JCM 16418]
MYKFIFRQWKNRKVTILFIVIGFFIGSLVMSLGTSASMESLEYIHDQRGGNPEQQVDVSLSRNGEWNQQDVEDTIERLSEFGETQLLNMENRKLDQYNDSFQIVPVLFHQEPDWHIPLVEGKYFSTEDMGGNQSIIIGKSIADKHKIKLGDNVVIGDKKFLVIGIGGRPSRETSWEHVIYMPWKGYLNIYPECFLEIKDHNAVSILVKNGKDRFMQKSKSLIETADQKGIRLDYKNVSNIDASSFRNSLVITVVATILIYTIAVINIVHLMLYWLVERKREIGIMKALGANNAILPKPWCLKS